MSVQQPSSLSGKTALVTGATSGIGLETAKALAGANIVEGMGECVVNRVPEILS